MLIFPLVNGAYKFAIVSLRNRKELLQTGDPVEFQISAREPSLAINIRSTKEKKRAFVEAVRAREEAIEADKEFGDPS